MKKETKLVWKCHTPNLLKEIGNHNPTMWAMSAPIMLFSRILAEVGDRAAELNDDKLNALMCRLTIYSVADPESPDYNKEIVKETLAKVGWE